MRALARSIRKVWLLRQAAFSLGLGVFIFVCVAFQFHPRTPFGKQCPTAPTVKVQAPVMCCGKVVGYEYRDPIPGETGFVQCQCAEKEEAKHFSLPPRLDVFLTAIVKLETQAFTTPMPELPAPHDPDFGRIMPPPVPPPPIAA